MNPGLPKFDINMVLPGASFDVDGIDFQIDFQREESRGDFMTRTGFVFGMDGGNLSVSYRVENGVGGFNTINSGNVYAVPNDDVFRTYRFFYLPVTGYAAILVDNAVVWSNTSTANRKMYWSGGDVTIGYLMDASGNNKVIFDNMTIGQVFGSPLPVELISFNAELDEQKNGLIKWSTATETNNELFFLEKSFNGLSWETIANIRGAGNSSQLIEYSFIDEYMQEGLQYYRLSQKDFDGQSTTFDILALNGIQGNNELTAYPNPVKNNLTITGDFETGYPIIFNSQGQNIVAPINRIAKNKINIEFRSLPQGIYFIKNQTNTIKVTKN